MRPLQTSAATLIAARKGIVLQTLVWMRPRNRVSGAIESIGMWSGDTDITLAVDGTPRLYYASGGLIEIGAITAAAGIEVGDLELQLAPLAEDGEMLVRGYDPRGASIEIHHLLIDPSTGRPAGGPVSAWLGKIDTVEVVSPGEDEPGRFTIRAVSAAIDGTKGLTLKKSDESQRLRKLPDGRPDRLGRYADISGKAEVKWGEA